MAGRKRKASTSLAETAETVGIDDHERYRFYYKEAQILIPSTANMDSSDFLTFTLVDAAVYDQSGNFANILDQFYLGPFTVRGRLVIDEDDNDQIKQLIQPRVRQVDIEIAESYLYCIGEGEGEQQVWVSGLAGWYELVPSAAYAKTFSKALEGIHMYYNISDQYAATGNRKRRNQPKAQELFLKYAVDVGDGSTWEDTVERCLTHSGLFFLQFLRESHVGWEDRPIYKWLLSQYDGGILEERKKAFKKCLTTEEELRKRMHKVYSKQGRKMARGGPMAAVPELDPNVIALKDQSRVSHASPDKINTEAEDMDAKEFALRAKRSRSESHDNHAPAAATPAQVPITRDTPMDGQTEAEIARAALPLLVEAVNESLQELIGRGKDAAKITLGSVTTLMHTNWRVKPYSACREILSYLSQPLLPHLDKRSFGDSPFYRWLQEMASGPPQRPSLINLSDIPSGLQRRKRLAGFVPKNMQKARAKDAAKEDSDASSARHRPPRVSGLRLRAAGKKRYRSPLEEGLPAGKTNKASSFFGDDEAMADGEDATSSDDEEDQGEEREEDEDADDAASLDEQGDPVRLVIRAEKIPSMVPRGPNGMWTCDQDDDGEPCGYIVRGADEAECRELIRQHFAEHEQREEQISLAVLEARGRHLPISHLLDKIRGMGERQMEKDEIKINGETAPRPIKRRLLV